MVIGALADGVARRVEAVGDGVSGLFFDPVIRLGVTGLARSGKTVFITSLVANLMDRARMPGLVANADGRIEAAFLQPQPDDTMPRFDYETHIAALTAAEPHWPASTEGVSQLRLSLRVRPSGLLSGFQGPRTVHLDIVDYPGEWLLDLSLMDLTYAQWSDRVLAVAKPQQDAQAFLQRVDAAHGAAEWQETDAKELARLYTRYLHRRAEQGFADITPGRFLLPGEMAGSPALTFAPLMIEERPARRGLWREMERRFEAYKSHVVRPFFRDHFARIDRQVVLVDALGAIHEGPGAVHDMRRAMHDILEAFRPGRNAFLTRLLSGKRVEKILFAATKADHLHHTQHGRLTAIMQALVRSAADRADFAGAETGAMAIASVRATVEDRVPHGGGHIDVVRGRLIEGGKSVALHPGELPEDPQRLLNPAAAGEERWLDGDYRVMSFAPAELRLKPGEGPPHIRLDKAAQFLLGDRL